MAATVKDFIAATRFGLGAKHGDFAAIGDDPRGWLSSQLDAKFIPVKDIPAPPDEPSSLNAEPCVMGCAAPGADQPDAARSERLKQVLAESNALYIKVAAARTRAAALSPAPFFERLVQFWSNHFTVSVTRRQDFSVLASFERDAIRPNVLGSFHDMLRASTRHPAMLAYLDNRMSMGTHSVAGENGGAGGGLNENLAREIMELHTLGVNGGYTQSDVTEFAKILTGWTARRGADGTTFFYSGQLHEPGDKKLLGETYHEAGEEEGEEALQKLARHPSTEKFVATKIARHFIADDPPQDAVDKLAQVFKDHDGALTPLYEALLAMDDPWKDPLAKLKTPNDVVLSVLRATEMAGNLSDAKIIDIHKQSGQMPWSAPSPAGWSDRALDWMGAEALLQRVGFARFAARVVHTRFDPARLMDDTIGPVLTDTTRSAVASAGSAEDGIALLFASPEFQRR